MLDIQSFANKDLVLKVSSNYDTRRFDQNKYEPFLDALCSEREYQKEAVRDTLRYFLGGEYSNLFELAKENYENNLKLRAKYNSLEDFTGELQLPNQLSCSLDHATATGKSYIIYGIARIMLAEGTVDQVLVLCPSNTIEAGLTAKFRNLSAERILKDLIPTGCKIANPRIINASSTIQKGDICIENIHATYSNTKSAIADSLADKGKRTLILNDEAHHLMNPSDTALKKWKEFLMDSRYGFKFIVNLSGTCYTGDDYFTDVIHRFSLRDAIEGKFIKSIRYVAEDSSGSRDEKFHKIYDNHVENRTVKYRKVKPLTIIVTQNISACKKLTVDLISFLAKKEKTGVDAAAQKVLIVTSAGEHKKNIPLLQRVDDRYNPVEWITSVSMLSEGWDVKNVFQIVPHEERAFNSKLLIAQVLGRGLRIPELYKGTQPVVTVFNHDKWSRNIKHLVEEVLEIEKRIHSYSVNKKEDYNFDLHNIRYKRVEDEVEYPQGDPYELLKKGYVNYSSQVKEIERSTTYVTALSDNSDVKKTLIEFKIYSIDETANEVVNKLRAIDIDLETNYSEEFGTEKVKEIIRESLKKIGEKGDWVSESNLQKTLQSFGVVYRKKAKSLRFKIEAQDVEKKNTKAVNKSSLGIGSLRHDSTIFWDNYSLTLSEITDSKLLKELEEDESLPKSSMVRVENKYNFKTPLNMVLASYKPERQFIKRLTGEQTARGLDAWIKSTDVGFYSIEYSWRKGEHQKQGNYNPDFFIKTGQDIIVVEIKADNDVSDENKAKLKYAREHFSRVNELQKEQAYYFKFLSPESYDLFFKALREKKYQNFVSELETKLEQA